MIVITSKREGFRRCGVAHAAGPTQWPDDRWTEAELDVLMADPMLTVDYLEQPLEMVVKPEPPGDAIPPPLGLVEDEDDPAAIEVDPPAAPEPYEIEFDEPAPEAVAAPKNKRAKKG